MLAIVLRWCTYAELSIHLHTAHFRVIGSCPPLASSSGWSFVLELCSHEMAQDKLKVESVGDNDEQRDLQPQRMAAEMAKAFQELARYALYDVAGPHG